MDWTLVLLLAFLWGISTSLNAQFNTPTKTTQLSAPSPPINVDKVLVINRTEETLTLQWNKVGDGKYNYTLSFNSQKICISGSGTSSTVSYKVSNLTAGTEYNFTLYTVQEGAQSTGYSFTAVTIPNSVDNISVKNRSETAIILEWNKVNNNSNYKYTLLYNGLNTSVSGSEDLSVVIYTVPDLTAGTEYSFIVHTVFHGVQSTGYSFTTVTIPNSVDNISVKNRSETAIILEWNKVNNNSNYKYTLLYNGLNNSVSGSEDLSVVIYTVPDLTAGTEYSFIVHTVFHGVQSTGYSFTTVTIPNSVDNISVKNRSETAIILEWNKVNNNSNYKYTLLYNGLNTSVSGSEDLSVVIYTVPDLTAGTEYSFIVHTVFHGVQSTGYSFTTVTTPNPVDNIFVTNRSETALMLEWTKVNNNSNYNYNYTLYYNDLNASVSGLEEGSSVTYKVSDLTAGMEYSFILHTVFQGVQSTGYSFTTVTTPNPVDNVFVTNRSETALILEWNQVKITSNYSYTMCYDSHNASINGSEEGSAVTYTVSDLTAGTEYSFILYTVFRGVLSTGYRFATVTTPLPVDDMSVKSRNETAVTLEWNQIDNNNYTLLYHGRNASIIGSDEGSAVTYTVSDLTAGTDYVFIFYSVFKGVQSAGYTFSTVTTPLSVTNIHVKNHNETTLILEWNKVNNNNIYNYTLSYNSQNVSLSGLENGSALTCTVTDLTAGTEYTFNLYTVFKGVRSRGYKMTCHTVPNSVTGLRCLYSSRGYGLTLVWDPPNGGRTAVQVNRSRTSYSHTGEKLYINGLLPAQWYTFSVSAISGPMQSVIVSITCQTDPRGVIAGVLTSLLLAIVILCIGIFIWYRKPKIFSKSKPSNENKLSSNKYQPVSLKKFPMHFTSMNCDQNRGFIEEYEDLGTVCKEQSCTVAALPENRKKNRFSNVLAYDSSRVKLAAQPGSDSDYINANYIHGYGKKKQQYIASQGPLPSTINDFWRMVWEQKTSAIVMLTNCTEGIKIKCEHYWPTDNMPHLYGNLWVTVQAEQKESCWTQREFVIRNESSSEERGVTHYHFTAWPDHGVPVRTDELIQFRWLVRNHIETFPFSGPIVVHCSAGVGRTGTLIVLDIVLQQMDKEELVSIADCVHRMRLSRPLMVQTQSQYVFLHQCIMDSMQPKEGVIPEPIYENSDMIFSNALALKEYKSSSPRL